MTFRLDNDTVPQAIDTKGLVAHAARPDVPVYSIMHYTATL